MSMIKAWLHDQMEKECREDCITSLPQQGPFETWVRDQMEEKIREEEMFFNADKHYEIEQAMREGMDEPTTQSEEFDDQSN